MITHPPRQLVIPEVLLVSTPPDSPLEILSIREEDGTLFIEVRGDPQYLFDSPGRELLGDRLTMPTKAVSDNVAAVTIRRRPGENIFKGNLCHCGAHPADQVLASVGELLLVRATDRNGLQVIHDVVSEGPPDPVFAFGLRNRLLEEVQRRIALTEIL